MNTAISQNPQADRNRRPEKSKASPSQAAERIRQVESPMYALINQHQAASLDTLPEIQVESPLYALINRRTQLRPGQFPVIQLESPLSALINGREPRNLDDLPSQPESPLSALVNHR